jgi:hypothetical protein
MSTNQKVNFTKMTEAQDFTAALAINSGKPWTKEDLNYLERHMFDMEIQHIAIALGRTAYSIETKLSKDPHFLELRKKAGDIPEVKELTIPAPSRNNFVSSDLDTLFGVGD